MTNPSHNDAIQAEPAPFRPTVAAYVRVSTKEQNEGSQREEISRWLQGNGIDPGAVRWFVDRGESGDTLNRPAFKDLQRSIFMGETKTIICYKLDRLSRKLHHGINLLVDWIDKGLRVVCTSQQIDFNGTIGSMLAAVLLGFAQLEQETRRERQAAGIAAAKKKSKDGKCPWGGRNNGTFKAKPERALALQAKGLSVAEIANAMGVAPMSVYRYLKIAKGN
jgi:DNA invertase Pin-like site-specific DNA recombinase